MEAYSPTNEVTEPKSAFEGQLKELFGRAVYSHKTHEKCADILLRRLSCITWAQISLSALSAGGYVSTLFGTGVFGSIGGFILSASLLVLNLYTKDHDLGESASKHRRTATDIWLIREKYLSLIFDLEIGGRPLKDLQKERDELAESLYAVYKAAPSTNSKAYAMAQKALKYDEEMYFSEDELNEMLPKHLRT
ncbi:MAG: SLATT domain-containing protein [Caldilineaceae bacterium]|nr:SLATT domain-containing protein [Caldilineaceae bacterium]